MNIDDYTKYRNQSNGKQPYAPKKGVSSKDIEKVAPTALGEFLRRGYFMRNEQDPEFSVDFKDLSEIQIMDTIVEIYKLDRSICDNRSKLNKGSSDRLVDTAMMFVLKQYARSVHDIKWEELDEWGRTDCRNFYHQHDAWLTPVSDFMNPKAISNNIGNEDVRRVLDKRWCGKMAFTDYRERVNIALGDIKGNLENNLIEVVTELNAVTEMQKTLEKDKETIEKMENISPATKALVRRIHPDTKTLLNLRRKKKED